MSKQSGQQSEQQKPPNRIVHPKLRPYRSRLGHGTRPLVSERVAQYCELVGEAVMVRAQRQRQQTTTIQGYLKAREDAARILKRRYI